MTPLERGIYSKLTGDATLIALLGSVTGVYPDVAVGTVLFPFIVFSLQPPSHDEYTYGTRAYEVLDYLIKAVDAGHDGDAANTVAERVDALLTNGSISVSGYTLGMAHRLGRISYPEKDSAGDFYQHRGGVYRFMLDPA